MKKTHIALCSSLICLVSLSAFAFQTYTPKPGTKERKDIMDAMREPVMKVVKKKVIFRVGHLKVSGDWAFMSGNAMNEDGSTLEDEFLWGEMTALLRKKQGRWHVQVWSFATDISGLEEAQSKYPEAPRSIFP